MDKEMRELQVTAIENGTVIDHIPYENVFKVIRILNLEQTPNQMLLGINLDSKKYGKKGIIKVSNTFFEDDEINKIALAAPTATLIVIRDFKVSEKRQVVIPDRIEKIVKCFNPNCITNHEHITTSFKVIEKKELKLQCKYCEKITAKNNMVFL